MKRSGLFVIIPAMALITGCYTQFLTSEVTTKDLTGTGEEYSPLDPAPPDVIPILIPVHPMPVVVPAYSPQQPQKSRDIGSERSNPGRTGTSNDISPRGGNGRAGR
jgi:hypothetical protein